MNQLQQIDKEVEWLTEQLDVWLAGKESERIREKLGNRHQRVLIFTFGDGYVYGLGSDPEFLMWETSDPEGAMKIASKEIAANWRVEFGTLDQMAFREIIHRIKTKPRVRARRSRLGKILLSLLTIGLAVVFVVILIRNS